MLKKVFCAVVCFLANLLSWSYSEAGETQFITVDAWVRISISGYPEDYMNVKISVPCSATRYFGDDGRPGCDNEKYGYVKINTSPAWPVFDGSYSYSASDNQTYWYWVYQGYLGTGACDWSKNCHGFAFGVGDWPDDSITIKASGSKQCWINDMSNATIADNNTHTVKIIVQDCPGSIGLRITSTSEKMKESPIFGLTSSCFGPPIDLALGNAPRSLINNLVPYRQ